MLHMYMLAARFRCFPAHQSPTWQQHLLDHFFYDAENRMTIEHNMHARGTRNRYLKDLFIQWRGLLAAYDEGIVKGDAVLAAAVWRNVFKADEEVDLRKVAAIVGYMRWSLKGLDSLPDELVETGNIIFEDPTAQLVLVNHRSKMMDVSFRDDRIANTPPIK
jgi:cytochrome b pre-mRNA-processing protein 3